MFHNARVLYAKRTLLSACSSENQRFEGSHRDSRSLEQKKARIAKENADELMRAAKELADAAEKALKERGEEDMRLAKTEADEAACHPPYFAHKALYNKDTVFALMSALYLQVPYCFSALYAKCS